MDGVSGVQSAGTQRFCEMGLGSCNYSLYYLYGPDGDWVRSYKLDMNVI
jgi:hypothetical protein